METSKEYFDEIAGNWDEMQQQFFSNGVREKVFEVAGISVGGQESKVAADIGAGTGYVTEGLLEKGVEVIAVDQSGQMLDLLFQKLGNKGVIKCVQADGNDIPLADDSVDFVFANMYLHHVVSPVLAIKEMYRILKKEGKLLISDLACHNYDFLVTEQHDIWKGFSRENMMTWLKAAGFSLVEIQSVGSNCSADSQCGVESASVSIFVSMGKK